MSRASKLILGSGVVFSPSPAETELFFSGGVGASLDLLPKKPNRLLGFCDTMLGGACFWLPALEDVVDEGFLLELGVGDEERSLELLVKTDPSLSVAFLFFRWPTVSLSRGSPYSKPIVPNIANCDGVFKRGENSFEKQM